MFQGQILAPIVIFQQISQMCLSFVSLTTKQLFKVFWGANRKDVINLTTTPTKKRTKRHFTCFLPPAKCKERISHKKRRSKIERRIFLLSRILGGRDFASSSAFKERKRFFFNRTKRLKNWTHPTSRYLTYIIISSLIASLAFSVVVTQNAPSS